MYWKEFIDEQINAMTSLYFWTKEYMFSENMANKQIKYLEMAPLSLFL